jgi:uridine kinase
MGYNSHSMKPIVIGVAGGTGSGKSTVAQAIIQRLGSERIVCIQHDSYYRAQNHLPLRERARVNYDHPDALENELLIEHLKRLLAGQAVEVPIYDFTAHTRTRRTRRVGPKGAVLVEGILIFADRALRDLMDIKVFVDTDADIRFIRRLQRDITERGRTLDSVIKQYVETVRPMHLEFVEPSKRYADIIIPEGGFNVTAIDMVVARVESMIEGRVLG